MRGEPVLVLPSSVARHLIGPHAGPWGTLHIKYDKPQELQLIVGATFKGENGFIEQGGFLGSHRSRYADITTDLGVWYRVSPDLQGVWQDLVNRDAAVAPDFFKTLVPQGWIAPPVLGTQIVLTAAVIDGTPLWRAWCVQANQVAPADLIYLDEELDIYDPLRGLWPLDDLAQVHATIIGLGSLGAPTALALAAYGVRHLTLIDPDRLQQHNLIRHVLDASHIGRFKVSGIEELITARFPDVTVLPLALDVIDAADKVRPILRESTIILGATDGVAPRQAINHLACWAQKPLVQAAILDSGGIGEIIRVRPGEGTGCLTCLRDRLREEDLIEPERSIDLGYGTGFIHRPMTAVGGDIALVGQFAAKVVVATILEACGHDDLRLPADHAVIGLRPVPGLEGPFDVCAGEIRWSEVGPHRPECPDCGELVDPSVATPRAGVES